MICKAEHAVCHWSVASRSWTFRVQLTRSRAVQFEGCRDPMSAPDQQKLDALYAPANVLAIKTTMSQADWDACAPSSPPGDMQLRLGRRCAFTWNSEKRRIHLDFGKFSDTSENGRVRHAGNSLATDRATSTSTPARRPTLPTEATSGWSAHGPSCGPPTAGPHPAGLGHVAMPSRCARPHPRKSRPNRLCGDSVRTRRFTPG
ncbi:hypothetical protein BN2156_05282 [Mycolicibacterium neworleansense]|uniref:Uncharacterized protein n=1 Tax=Mycolicibacterium neworleansense TaxID=146018 RepID=A0A0H5RX44_9MYCO|nr:hypothetical protein BN2156_05282 [Mycolicibacterium neworleansense]